MWVTGKSKPTKEHTYRVKYYVDGHKYPSPGREGLSSISDACTNASNVPYPHSSWLCSGVWVRSTRVGKISISSTGSLYVKP